jgi:hypothetical protein
MLRLQLYRSITPVQGVRSSNWLFRLSTTTVVAWSSPSQRHGGVGVGVLRLLSNRFVASQGNDSTPSPSSSSSSTTTTSAPMMDEFHGLGVSPWLYHKLISEFNITRPTSIQRRSLPYLIGKWDPNTKRLRAHGTHILSCHNLSPFHTVVYV